MSTLDDDAIQTLVQEPKGAVDPRSLVPTQETRGHLRRDVQVTGGSGSNFQIKVRQSRFDAFNFSVILGYQMPGSNRLFRLRRHNGLSHEHSNPLENERFFAFHIHLATERYQLEGYVEDHFAEPTDAYADLRGAIDHLLTTAGFDPPTQGTLTV